MKIRPKILCFVLFGAFLAILWFLPKIAETFESSSFSEMAPRTMLNTLGKEWKPWMEKELGKKNHCYRESYTLINNGVKSKAAEYRVCTDISGEFSRIFDGLKRILHLKAGSEDLFAFYVMDKVGIPTATEISIPSESRYFAAVFRKLELETPYYQKITKESPDLFWDSVCLDSAKKDSFVPEYSTKWKSGVQGKFDITLKIRMESVVETTITLTENEKTGDGTKDAAGRNNGGERCIDLSFLTKEFLVGDSIESEVGFQHYIRMRPQKRSLLEELRRKSKETNQSRIEVLKKAGFVNRSESYSDDFGWHSRWKLTTHPKDVSLVFDSDGFVHGMGNTYRPAGVFVKHNAPNLTVKFHKEIDIPKTIEECRARFPILYEHTCLDGRERILVCEELSFYFRDGKLISYYVSIDGKPSRNHGLSLRHF